MPDNNDERMPSTMSVTQPPDKLDIPLSLVIDLVAERQKPANI